MIFIGRGAFGEVYLREDPIASNCAIAVKYIRAQTGEARRTFEKEWQALKKFAHPNIITIHDVFEEEKDGIPYFAFTMDYCERKSLRDVIDNPKIVYNMATVLHWSKEIFSALSTLLKHRIIHRDIKPQNILVTKDFSLKVSDFGCVREVDALSSLRMAGTARYMSPESVASEIIVSYEGDLYSSALVLWECIERQIIFSSEYGINFNSQRFFADLRERKEKAKVPSPNCIHPIGAIILNCTQFEYLDRPNVLELFLQVSEMNKVGKEFDFDSFWPNIEEDQRRLVRPIGFDGTSERHFVFPDLTPPPASLGVSLDLPTSSGGIQEHFENDAENFPLVRKDEFIKKFWEMITIAEIGEGLVAGLKLRNAMFKDKLNINFLIEEPPRCLNFYTPELIESINNLPLTVEERKSFWVNQQYNQKLYSTLPEVHARLVEAVRFLQAMIENQERPAALRERLFKLIHTLEAMIQRSPKYGFDIDIYYDGNNEWFLLSKTEKLFLRTDLTLFTYLNGEFDELANFKAEHQFHLTFKARLPLSIEVFLWALRHKFDETSLLTECSTKWPTWLCCCCLCAPFCTGCMLYKAGRGIWNSIKYRPIVPKYLSRGSLKMFPVDYVFQMGNPIRAPESATLEISKIVEKYEELHEAFKTTFECLRDFRDLEDLHRAIVDLATIQKKKEQKLKRSVEVNPPDYFLFQYVSDSINDDPRWVLLDFPTGNLGEEILCIDLESQDVFLKSIQIAQINSRYLIKISFEQLWSIVSKLFMGWRALWPAQIHSKFKSKDILISGNSRYSLFQRQFKQVIRPNLVWLGDHWSVLGVEQDYGLFPQ